MSIATIKASLTDNGFREYKSCLTPHAESAWQIKVCVSFGRAIGLSPSTETSRGGTTLYFINAYVYKRLEPQLPDAVEFSASLYPDGSPEEWITLQFHGSSIERAMEFFAKAYKNLNCVPDRHNQ